MNMYEFENHISELNTHYIVMARSRKEASLVIGKEVRKTLSDSFKFNVFMENVIKQKKILYSIENNKLQRQYKDAVKLLKTYTCLEDLIEYELYEYKKNDVIRIVTN